MLEFQKWANIHPKMEAYQSINACRIHWEKETPDRFLFMDACIYLWSLLARRTDRVQEALALECPATHRSSHHAGHPHGLRQGLGSVHCVVHCQRGA